MQLFINVLHMKADGIDADFAFISNHLVAHAFHEVLQEVDREQTYKRIGDWIVSRFGV